MIRVTVFDFDGVLADSVPVKDRALQSLFLEHGPETAQRALELWMKLKGTFRPLRIRMIHEEIFGIPPDDAALRRLLRRFEEAAVEQTIAAPWIAGARETLERLQGKGMPLYVASAGPQREVEEIVARRGMAGYFAKIHGFGENTCKSSVLRDICSDLAITPQEMLFIGDSLTDGLAARQAGCRFVGIVPSGAINPFPEDDPILPDLTGVVDWIERGGRASRPGRASGG